MSETWQTAPLGQHCYIKARIGWRGLAASEYTENGPYLIAGKHVDDGVIDWERCDHITDFRYLESSEIALQDGDVIITKDGTIGRVARIDKLPGRATINGTMMLIRARTGLDYRFLFHVLNGNAFKKLVDDKVSGSSIPHIFQRDMVLLPVSFPPIASQKLTANMLDALDVTIRKTAMIIAKLKQAKQGLLHDLLTRGVDANGEIRPRYEDAPHLYQKSELGLLPKTWVTKELGELLGEQQPAMRSGPFGSSLLKSELVESGIPFLGIDNVHVEKFSKHFKRFVSHKKYAELSQYTVRPNDVMITIMGTVGRCCLVPGDIGIALSSKHTWVITLDPNQYISYLAMLQINYSPWALNHLSKDEQGGIMAAIRSATLRSLPLPTPPIHEQQQIATKLVAISERIELEEMAIQKLQNHKIGLMDDLLTGRVRVTPLLATEGTSP